MGYAQRHLAADARHSHTVCVTRRGLTNIHSATPLGQVLPPSLTSIVLLPPDSDVVSPTLSILPQTPALTPAHPLQHLKTILGTVWGQQRGYERWKMSRTMLGFLKMFCLPIKLGGHHKTEYMQHTTILTTCSLYNACTLNLHLLLLKSSYWTVCPSLTKAIYHQQTAHKVYKNVGIVTSQPHHTLPS